MRCRGGGRLWSDKAGEVRGGVGASPRRRPLGRRPWPVQKAPSSPAPADLGDICTSPVRNAPRREPRALVWGVLHPGARLVHPERPRAGFRGWPRASVPSRGTGRSDARMGAQAPGAPKRCVLLSPPGGGRTTHIYKSDRVCAALPVFRRSTTRSARSLRRPGTRPAQQAPPRPPPISSVARAARPGPGPAARSSARAGCADTWRRCPRGGCDHRADPTEHREAGRKRKLGLARGSSCSSSP